MAQYYIQMVQPIRQWQHASVTQGIRFRHLLHVHMKLTEYGVLQPQIAL